MKYTSKPRHTEMVYYLVVIVIDVFPSILTSLSLLPIIAIHTVY